MARFEVLVRLGYKKLLEVVAKLLPKIAVLLPKMATFEVME